MEAGQAGIRLLGDRADQCEARESSAGRPVPADIEVDTAKSWERIGWQADPEGARLPHHGEYFTSLPVTAVCSRPARRSFNRYR